MIITVSNTKGVKCQVSDFSLVVDPGNPPAGGKADIILKTRTEAPILEFPEISGGLSSEIIGAGEYEISGTKVIGIQLDRESTAKEIRTIYLVKMDEINLCFLGDLKFDLTEEALDRLGEVDILFIPSPSKDYDGPVKPGEPGHGAGKKIAALVKQIEPHVIIPSSDKDVDQLAKDLGQKPEKMEKLVIKKKELLEMNSKLIVISS